jgi:NitT/TauT family transport system substrate-binding protein
MKARTRLVGIAAALLVTVGGAQAVQAEPLRITHTTWVGYGPLFVAEEKGFFADEGVEVELINIDYGGAATDALVDGQVDASTISLDTAVARFQSYGQPLVCVLVLDDDRPGTGRGGTGLVANKDIRTIGDLKGKMIAFQEHAPPQFYLNVLLKEAGLSEADIEPVVLPARDAAEAFMLKEVKAAVTWEPWLTQAKNTAHGHLLADSSDHPGLLVDGVFTTADVFRGRKAEFQAVARAWAMGVVYYRAHPQEAVEIMARRVGGGLDDPAVFAETLEGVRFYDGAGNRAYFGTPENPGPIYDTLQKAIDVWHSVGVLKADVAPADFIAHGVWDE